MNPGILSLDVLQPALVEADAQGGAQPLLLVVVGQVAQLFDLELVALTLVDVGEAGFAELGGDAGGGVEDVLEPVAVLVSSCRVLDGEPGGGLQPSHHCQNLRRKHYPPALFSPSSWQPPRGEPSTASEP